MATSARFSPSSLPRLGLGRGVVRGILRAHSQEGIAASYAFAPSEGAGLSHASLSLINYAHCSSPIRRYADLHNQHILFQSMSAVTEAGDGVAVADFVTNSSSLDALNARAGVIAQYHARVDSMELAYRCRDTPQIFKGKVEVDEEGGGQCLFVYTEKRRVRVPLHDTYQSRCASSSSLGHSVLRRSSSGAREVTVELVGILKAGRTQLRLRVPSVAEAATAAGAGLTSAAAAGFPRRPGTLPPGLGGDRDGGAGGGGAGGASSGGAGGTGGGVDANFYEALRGVGVVASAISCARRSWAGEACGPGHGTRRPHGAHRLRTR